MIRWLLVLAAAVLLASACGSSDDDTSDTTANDAGAEVSAGESDAEADDSSTSTEDSGSDDDADSAAPDLAGLRPITTQALGGLRLGVATDIGVVHEGELIQIRQPDGSGQVIISRVSLSSSGEPVTTVDEFIEAGTSDGSATAEPTGDTLTVLGYELEEYAFRAEGEGLDPRLFPSSFAGMASNSAWAPSPIADVYLGDVEGGVMAAGVVTDDETSLPTLHALLEEVVPTLSLTAPPVMPVPDTAPTGFTTLGEPDPVVPREVSNGLVQPFSPAEPGVYDLANLAQPTTIDIGEGWFVAPNFPGFVALADLTAGRAGGPGDHDVSFLQGVTGVHSLGPTGDEQSDPVPLQTPEELEAFLADPPSGLIVSNVDEEATLGGQTVVQFDVEVDPKATCQAEIPCKFAFSPANNDYVKFVASGYVNRFWWYTDAPNGGLLISASAPAASTNWLDGRAAELLATVEFG
jgi:hypothetical protein